MLKLFFVLDVTSHVPATFNKVVTIATDTAKDISRAHEKDVEKISRAAGTARHVYRYVPINKEKRAFLSLQLRACFSLMLTLVDI
tara:strand:- start:148 stop:402 length:255 start_codon:yes stop_codon:yes gene_type:complete